MGELTLTIDLDEEGRTQMYEQLCEKFDKNEVDKTLEGQIVKHITQMFDNREQLEEKV